MVVRRRRVSGRRAALVEDEDEDEDEDKDKDEDEGFVDASPGKRASGRISSGRRRKSEVWKRNWTALREGKRREDAELETDDEEDRRDGGEEDDDLQDFIDFIEDDLETEALDAEAKRKRGSRGTEDRRGSRLRARPGEPSASAFLARALMDDDFAPRRSRADARGATATKSDDDDDDDDENLGDDDDNFVDEWVACECGVDRDDGAAMIQCCNPRCGVWQHAACVDVDPDEFERRGNASRWYCARCDAAGRSRAPAPPDKPAPGARTDTTSPSSRRIWSSKMTEALRADDFRAAKTLLMRHPNPPSRGAMLARAAAAAARECVRLLMGGGGGNVGSETSRGLPRRRPGTSRARYTSRWRLGTPTSWRRCATRWVRDSCGGNRGDGRGQRGRDAHALRGG